MSHADDLLKRILKDLPTFLCHDLNHSKKDQHDDTQKCPSLKRLNEVIEEARAYLKESK